MSVKSSFEFRRNVSGETLDLLKGRFVGWENNRPHLLNPERAGVALEEIEVIPGREDLDGFVRRVEILIIGAEAGNKGFALAGFDTYRLRSGRMAGGQQKVDPVSKGDIPADGLEFQALETLPVEASCKKRMGVHGEGKFILLNPEGGPGKSPGVEQMVGVQVRHDDIGDVFRPEAFAFQGLLQGLNVLILIHEWRNGSHFGTGTTSINERVFSLSLDEKDKGGLPAFFAGEVGIVNGANRGIES